MLNPFCCLSNFIFFIIHIIIFWVDADINIVVVRAKLNMDNPVIQEVYNDAEMTIGDKVNTLASISYDYTWPLVMLACLGVAALVIGFILKAVDKKKHLGLE